MLSHRYQIVRTFPRYCPSTDAFIGAGYERLPNAYEMGATARCIAARLERTCREEGGDDAYHVIPWGGDPTGRFMPASRAEAWPGDMPF